MQPRIHTQKHPRPFIKFLIFLNSSKKIFTFFFLVSSIEHTNSERTTLHSSKSVNNFGSYKQKTDDPVRFQFHVRFSALCKQTEVVDDPRSRVASLPGSKMQSISCGRVDQ